MTEENEVLQRMRAIIHHYGLSDLDFAKSIDLPQSTLSNIFTRNSYPKTDVLISILNKYSDISAEWLLRGYGEMLKSKAPAEKAEDTGFMRRLLDNMLGVCEDQRKTIARLEQLREAASQK